MSVVWYGSQIGAAYSRVDRHMELKARVFSLSGHAFKFLLSNPRVLLALAQVLSMQVVNEPSLLSSTPR